MPAQEDWIGHLHQRIVHLEVEQVADTAFPHAFEQTAFRQRGQCTAVTVGTEEQAAMRFQKQFARRQVQGRHGALTKEEYSVLWQSEISLFGEEFFRLGVGGWAGHDEQRRLLS